MEDVKDKIRTVEETHGLLSMEMINSLFDVEVSSKASRSLAPLHSAKAQNNSYDFWRRLSHELSVPFQAAPIRDCNAVDCDTRSRFIFPEKIRPRLLSLFKVAKEVLATQIMERIYAADEIVRIAAVYFQQLLRTFPLKEHVECHRDPRMVDAARLLFNGLLRESLSVPTPIYCEGREEFTINLKTRRAIEEPWDIVVHALLSAHRQCCDELFLLL